MTDRKHALLSASSACRWLYCTPSARLEEKIADTDSTYAKEGTLAHEIAEKKLNKYFNGIDFDLETLKRDPLYNPEMNGYTDIYVEYIKQKVYELANSYVAKPYIALEKQVSYDNYAYGGFGTADCILIGGDNLYIIDFKYGKGVEVSAEANPQLKLYALGAINMYGFIYSITKINLVIIQPRINNISEWGTSKNDLLRWGENIVKPQAQKANLGIGELVAGEHCKFCRIKSTCNGRKDYALEAAKKAFDKPPILTNDEISEMLPKLDSLITWANDIKDYAYKELLAGREIKGYKLVEGRSIRSFKDTEAAFKRLINTGTVDEELLYERKPVTLTTVEKLLGTATFNTLLEDYVIKPHGKPTMVPESDKRPKFSSVDQMFEDKVDEKPTKENGEIKEVNNILEKNTETNIVDDGLKDDDLPF